MSTKELLVIHQRIKAIQARESISYAQACDRLYAEQMECLKAADVEANAWANLRASIQIALIGAKDHVKQDP